MEAGRENAFVDRFLQGRRVRLAPERMVASVDDDGTILMDPLVAKVAMFAEGRGIGWVRGGVSFIADHEYGHHAMGAPIPESRLVIEAGETRANVYALAKSSRPLEDFSSMLALVAAVQYCGAMRQNWIDNHFFELRYGGGRVEDAASRSIDDTIRHQEASRYLRQDALDSARREGLSKFMELLREVQGGI